MEIDVRVLPHYLGEVLSSPLEEFTVNYRGPRYSHPTQCDCKACLSWSNDRTNNNRKLYKKYIECELPFSLETVIIENIKSVSIDLETKPWQRCSCDDCSKLYVEHSFSRETVTGNLTMEDIQIIRNKILSFTMPSILPLGAPDNKPNVLYHLKRCQELIPTIHKKHLSIKIMTTSDDGSGIEYDPHHGEDPEIPFALSSYAYSSEMISKNANFVREVMRKKYTIPSSQNDFPSLG